jgi:hypothetical protein
MNEQFPTDTRCQNARLRDFLFDSLIFLTVSTLILTTIGCHQHELQRDSINRVTESWTDYAKPTGKIARTRTLEQDVPAWYTGRIAFYSEIQTEKLNHEETQR